MYGKLNWCISGAVALAIAFGIRAVPASAQSIEEKAQTCTGCHGEDGKLDGTRGHAGYRGIFLEKAMA